MLRLNLLLLGMLLLSALGVVTAQHRARRAYMELHQQQQIAKQLEVEWGQLQLEQSTWAMHARIELEARKRLNMRTPEQQQSRLVVIER